MNNEGDDRLEPRSNQSGLSNQLSLKDFSASENDVLPLVLPLALPDHSE